MVVVDGLCPCFFCSSIVDSGFGVLSRRFDLGGYLDMFGTTPTKQNMNIMPRSPLIAGTMMGQRGNLKYVILKLRISKLSVATEESNKNITAITLLGARFVSPAKT